MPLGYCPSLPYLSLRSSGGFLLSSLVVSSVSSFYFLAPDPYAKMGSGSREDTGEGRCRETTIFQ